MSDNVLEYKGFINVFEQEGGYAAPGVELMDMRNLDGSFLDLGVWLRERGAEPGRGGSPSDRVLEVRMLIEVLLP